MMMMMMMIMINDDDYNDDYDDDENNNINTIRECQLIHRFYRNYYNGATEQENTKTAYLHDSAGSIIAR